MQENRKLTVGPRGIAFRPSINDSASCNFRVSPRSDYCHLFQQLLVRKINSRLRLPSPDPYSDHVANASILHEVSLDLNCGLLQGETTGGKRSRIVFRKFNECVPDPRTPGVLIVHHIGTTVRTKLRLRNRFPNTAMEIFGRCDKMRVG